jgi:uroporphyrinogen-III synthase
VEALQASGHIAVVEPLLAIRFLDTELPSGPFDALVATSANGIHALTHHPARGAVEQLPLFAVGRRTAEAGREAGLRIAGVADGDSAALDRLLLESLPGKARLLHLAGRDRARDVGGSVQDFRHDVATAVLYAADSGCGKDG